MLTDDDLKAAIAEGILTEDQAARLMAFTRQRQGGEAAYASRDEPFRLFRGFRDFFLAIGLVVLAVGLVGAVVTFFGDPMPGSGDAATATLVRLTGPTAALAAFAWLMAEWVTARLRLPLASIVIVICFCAAAAWLGAQLAAISGDEMRHIGDDWQVQVSAGILALVAAILFYLRFRLPFVLLPLAAAAVGTVIALVAAWDESWLDDNLRIVTAVAGLAVFAAAMRHDLSDPNRITRRAECAFWLHLLAAPLIVHSVVGGFSDDAAPAELILAIVAVLAVVALFIDRRALLVSALVYLAAAISSTIENVSLLAENSFVATAVVLGLVLVSLGLGWTPARNALISLFPDTGLRRRLPPVSRPSDAL